MEGKRISRYEKIWAVEKHEETVRFWQKQNKGRGVVRFSKLQIKPKKASKSVRPPRRGGRRGRIDTPVPIPQRTAKKEKEIKKEG